MKKDMSATYKTLEEPHGVLMNHKTPWARGMNRSLDGLRLNLSSGRTNEDWAMKISQPRFESVTEMGGGGATPQHNLREISTEFRGVKFRCRSNSNSLLLLDTSGRS